MEGTAVGENEEKAMEDPVIEESGLEGAEEEGSKEIGKGDEIFVLEEAKEELDEMAFAQNIQDELKNDAADEPSAANNDEEEYEQCEDDGLSSEERD